MTRTARKPNLFIAGAPKCGTSALYEYLRAHPDIFMPELKEPLYFGRDHHRINHSPRTEEQYLALFAGAGNQRWVGEGSTSYLHSVCAAGEIKEFSPDARIIIMLRNPVDVMYAYHSEHLHSGFETIESFEAALDAENERKHGRCLPRTRPGLLETLYYRDVAQFSGQVARYFDTFGREQVHVIIFDDFKRDTADAYRRTLNFLDVNPEFQPEFQIVNPNQSVRSVAWNNFLWNPPRSIQTMAQAVFPAGARRRVVDVLKGMNLKQQPRPPIDPRLRRRLAAECAPDLSRLSELLNRDLSHWTGDSR